jgi:hypothetical protein
MGSKTETKKKQIYYNLLNYNGIRNSLFHCQGVTFDKQNYFQVRLHDLLLTSLRVVKLEGRVGLISEFQVVYCPSPLSRLAEARLEQAKIKLKGSTALSKT